MYYVQYVVLLFQFPMVWPHAVIVALFCILQNLGPVTPILYRDTYFLKETEVIPRNEKEYRMLTKDLNCEGNGLNVAYVLHSTEIKTIMVCTPDRNLSGKWCPEFNPDKPYSLNGIVQSKFTAECENLRITPCKGIYSARESYLFFECFQIFGGISSPMESVQMLKLCEKRYKNSSQVVAEKENIISEKQIDVEAHKNSSKKCEQMLVQCEKRYENISQVVDEKEHIINDSEMSLKKCENTFNEILVVIGGILCAIFCLFLYNCLLLYLIKRFYYKEDINYKNYIESRKILFINFFKSTYSVSDVIGSAENNTSHLGTASLMEAFIKDQGNENKEEQDVNVKVREGNNQHPAYPDKNKLTRLTVDLDVN